MKKKLILLAGGLALFVLLSAGVGCSQLGPEVRTKDAFLKQAERVKARHADLEDGDYFVTITFMKRASYDEVDWLVRKYAINPTSWDTQWQDSKSMTVTAGTRVSVVGPEWKSKDMVRGDEKNQDFGFIDLSGDMPSKKVAALQAEELVFLVDTRGGLRFMNNPEQKRRPSMYYKLVKFGLNKD